MRSEVEVLGCAMEYLFCCLSCVGSDVGLKQYCGVFECILNGVVGGVEEKSVEGFKEG